jgi:hypothetical protein
METETKNRREMHKENEERTRQHWKRREDRL